MDHGEITLGVHQIVEQAIVKIIQKDHALLFLLLKQIPVINNCSAQGLVAKNFCNIKKPSG